MKKASRLLSFALLGIFLYQYLGCPLYLTLGIHELNEEFQEISKNEKSLLTLRIDNSTLRDSRRFIKLSSSEFIFDGNLYDYSKKESKNGYTLFQCRQDSREQELRISFGQQVADNSDIRSIPLKGTSKSTLKISLQDIILPQKQTVQHNLSNDIYSHSSVFSSYKSVSLFISSPPPKFS